MLSLWLLVSLWLLLLLSLLLFFSLVLLVLLFCCSEPLDWISIFVASFEDGSKLARTCSPSFS